MPNTAPLLSDTNVVLSPVAEDAGAPAGAVGTLVSALVGAGNVADPDAGALYGIAVTAADAAHGTWWYSTDDGAHWTQLGSVSDGAARLLAGDAQTRLYFQGAQDYNGTLS